MSLRHPVAPVSQGAKGLQVVETGFFPYTNVACSFQVGVATGNRLPKLGLLAYK